MHKGDDVDNVEYDRYVRCGGLRKKLYSVLAAFSYYFNLELFDTANKMNTVNKSCAVNKPIAVNR